MRLLLLVSPKTKIGFKWPCYEGAGTLLHTTVIVLPLFPPFVAKHGASVTIMHLYIQSSFEM